MNTDEVIINMVELATKLAHNKLANYYSNKIKMFIDFKAEELVYTQEAQTIFDNFYDYYYEIIENVKIKKI